MVASFLVVVEGEDLGEIETGVVGASSCLVLAFFDEFFFVALDFVLRFNPTNQVRGVF